MNLQPISTKQLRQNLSEIMDKLAMGQSFYWIHRSQPIGLIQPLPDKSQRTAKKRKTDYQEFVKKLAGGIKLKKYPTPAQLNKIIEQEYNYHD